MKTRLPVVFSVEEVTAILALLDGTKWLVASFLYRSGMRYLECLRRRAKEMDFGYGQIVVRDGKGGKGRATLLPQSLVGPLYRNLDRVRTTYAYDLEHGFGAVPPRPRERVRISGCGNTSSQAKAEKQVGVRSIDLIENATFEQRQGHGRIWACDTQCP